jgi:GDP-mannose pyrophosphatase NudK
MNDNVNIKNTEILSSEKYVLKKVTFEHLKKNGSNKEQICEVYDIGDAATVLLYDPQQKTVMLIKQFRLPSFLKGNETGMLIEACAGKIDANESAEDCIKREIEEETGYRVPIVKKIFEAYPSPGSVAELIYFFVAEYDASMKVNDGGGIEDEEIEIIEISFEEAINMIDNGEIKDAKTIMLLQYAKVHELLQSNEQNHK